MLKTRDVIRSGVLRGYERHMYIQRIYLFNEHTGCILGFDRGGHAKNKQIIFTYIQRSDMNSSKITTRFLLMPLEII